jgi:hypothetical protein
VPEPDDPLPSDEPLPVLEDPDVPVPSDDPLPEVPVPLPLLSELMRANSSRLIWPSEFVSSCLNSDSGFDHIALAAPVERPDEVPLPLLPPSDELPPVAPVPDPLPRLLPDVPVPLVPEPLEPEVPDEPDPLEPELPLCASASAGRIREMAPASAFVEISFVFMRRVHRLDLSASVSGCARLRLSG